MNQLQTKMLLTLLIVTISVAVRGQGSSVQTPFVPTSPQVEAFMKYGDYNINYSTGIPDISIPLFEINHRGFKIPLNLKYYPQPLKQGYNYDVFGHGWAMSMRSCVSRTIEFAPDEARNFIIDQPSGYYSVCGDCFNQFNYAHDKFNAILPDGTSFDFVIDKINGVLKYSVSGDRSLKITCTYTTLNITSFEIIDENGVKYTFSGGDVYGVSQITHNNYISWVLTRIDLPTTSDPIYFYYTQNIDNCYGNVERSIHFSDYKYVEDYNDPSYNSPPNYTYRMKLLSSIYYGNNSVRFTYTDASTTSAKNYLDAMQIYEGQSVLKTLSFTTSVYNVISPSGSVPLAQLDAITITGSNTLESPLEYLCSYYSIGTPFQGTDYWGYLNHDSYSTGVANFNLYVGWIDSRESSYSSLGICEAQKISGDNCPLYKVKLASSSNFTRTPSSDHGILRKLTYPTGGYTEFEFGNHQFLTQTDSNGDYIMDYQQRKPSVAGGFRIEKIKNYTAVGELSNIKNFRYGLTYAEAYQTGEGYDYELANYPNAHTGLGEAVVDPNVLTFMDFTNLEVEFPFPNLTIGKDEQNDELLENPFNSTNYPMYLTGYIWRSNFSASNFRKLVNGRSPVIYPQVTVYDGEIDEYEDYFPNGKTVYNYDIMDSGSDLFYQSYDNMFFEQPYYVGNVLVTEPKDYLYDKCTMRRDYSFDGQDFTLVQKELTEWLPSLKFSTDLIFMNLYPDPYTPSEYTYTDELFTSTTYYLGNARLDSKVTTSYFLNDSISKREFYGYNQRNQIVSHITENSDTRFTKEMFEYPEIKISGTTPAIVQEMVAQNILSPVLKDSVCIADSYETLYNGQAISSFQTDYDEYVIGSSTYLLPSKSYKLEMKPGGNYVAQSEVVKYSINGNPLEVIEKDGIRSSFVWSYNDNYPVVKAENIDYNTLKAAVESAASPYSLETFWGNLTTVTYNNSTWNSFNTNLRNNSTLQNAMVTTYTYKPLVGMTSETGPDGRTTYYEYDGFGRLRFAKDSDGNIIKMYSYHYAE